MKIYITRHGQSLSEKYYGGDVTFPGGDKPLTDLGRAQAKALAERLKTLGFRGEIAASPYRRTAETAEIIASELGLGVTLLPCLREIMKEQKAVETFHGMTLAELHDAFPSTRKTKELPFPWWTAKMDTREDVAARVKEGLDAFLPTVKSSEVLLVAHGASCLAMRRNYFKIERRQHAMNCNCALTFFDTETGEAYAHSTEHLPQELITNNPLTYADLQAAKAHTISEAAAFSAAHPGERLLHIGDTFSFAYDFYRDLIAAVKPSIILHTGDFADEFKAGRVEKDCGEWQRAAAEMVSILRESGAKIIAVAGNNDLEPSLRAMAPDFEIVPCGTVMTLGGRNACLSHEPEYLVGDAEDFFYGHSLTGETHTAETNEDAGKRYFNSLWGSSVHDLQSGAYLFVENPKF